MAVRDRVALSNSQRRRERPSDVVSAQLKSQPTQVSWTGSNGESASLRPAKPLTLQDLTPEERAAVQANAEKKFSTDQP